MRRLRAIAVRSRPVDPAVAGGGYAFAIRGVKVAQDPKALAEVPEHDRRHVDQIAKALQKASVWSTPNARSGTVANLARARPISAEVLARQAHAALSPTSNVTPLDVETALREQGIDWVEPFAPGRPLTPFYGYFRRPRDRNYQVATNVSVQPRQDRIPFETLRHLINSYDVAQICYRHTIQDLRSMRLRFEVMDGYEENCPKEIAAAKAFLRRPDRKFDPITGKTIRGSGLTTRNWLCKHATDVWRFDAGTLYRQKDRAGRLVSLPVADGTLFAPVLDYFGDTPHGEAPAYQQTIQGIPWNWLRAEDLIYSPMWPHTEDPYGISPIETILINANTDIRLQTYFLQFFCYDDQTEVLTRDGWRKFLALDGSEEYATRSAEGEFEWQHTVDGEIHRFDYDGDLVKFKNQCVDMLVTPNHRMLVRHSAAYAGRRKKDKASYDWHIRRADFFVENPTAEFQVPVTSEFWSGTDPESTVVFDAEPDGKRARVKRIEMPNWAWARFLGLFVAEGHLRRQAPGEHQRYEITVSQMEGGDLDEVRRILKDTGLPWRYDGKSRFTLGSKALYGALLECGHRAPNKRLPATVMDWGIELIEEVLHGLQVGDGHTAPSGQRVYTTTSAVLADQVQELWQKVGVYASVNRYEPDPRTFAKLVQYRVRTRPEEAFRVPKPTLEEYHGQVSCVSVPNGIIFVRRNGKAMWCGNTTGTVPEAFAVAPEDQSDVDSLADWQELYNDWTYGDQSQRWGLRWLPHGTELEFYKPQQFDPDVAEYVMRRTVAGFMLTPHDLGFTEDVNRATGDTQMDTQFRISSLPNVGYYEDMLDSILQEDLSLPVQVRFDTGREKEDRLMEAQAHQIYVSIAAESPDEVRDKVLGYPINPEERVPRLFDSNRLGPIPIKYLLATAGDVDPRTGAPFPGTVQPMDLVLPGTPGPDPAGSGPPPYSNARSDDKAAGRKLPARGKTGTTTPPKVAGPLGPGPLTPAPQSVLASASKPAPNRGPRPRRSVAVGARPDQRTASRRTLKASSDLKRWRTNTLKRVARGESPRPFMDSEIPPDVYGAVWGLLKSAETAGEVLDAFAKAQAISAKSHDTEAPEVAGLALVAQDSGRVLMVRRGNKDDDGDGSSWEFAAGHLDAGESPIDAAIREWEEETGAKLPKGAEQVGTWRSEDGKFQGFVYRTEKESDIDIGTPDGDEIAACAWWDIDDLDDSDVRDKVRDNLDRSEPILERAEKAVGILDYSGRLIIPPNLKPGDTVTVVSASDLEDASPPKVLRPGPGGHREEELVQYYAPRVRRALVKTVQPMSIAKRFSGLGAQPEIIESVVASIYLKTRPLENLLMDLWSDSWLAGAKDGLGHGVVLKEALEDAVNAVDWHVWAPGSPGTNVPGLEDLTQQIAGLVKGITETTREQIEKAVVNFVKGRVAHVPWTNAEVESLAREIAQMIDAPARAMKIARSEVNRAMTAAAADLFRRAGYVMFDLLTHIDACKKCLKVAEANPHLLSDTSALSPLHSQCRCSIAPAR